MKHSAVDARVPRAPPVITTVGKEISNKRVTSPLVQDKELRSVVHVAFPPDGFCLWRSAALGITAVQGRRCCSEALRLQV